MRSPSIHSHMFPTHVGMNRGKSKLTIKQICMFPTHVGMNREALHESILRLYVPHTRGDEPSAMDENREARYMFPTHVGMNRTTADSLRCHSACSPHTWG